MKNNNKTYKRIFSLKSPPLPPTEDWLSRCSNCGHTKGIHSMTEGKCLNKLIITVRQDFYNYTAWLEHDICKCKKFKLLR